MMENSRYKFRAWDIQTESMRDVLVIDWVNELIDLSGGIIERRTHEVELMQYTGLKDKNGVEIYEGDVLFHPLQGRIKVFYPYRETVASYGLRNIDNGFGSTLQDSHAVWEVIGNIYQNKGLI